MKLEDFYDIIFITNESKVANDPAALIFNRPLVNDQSCTFEETDML